MLRCSMGICTGSPWAKSLPNAQKCAIRFRDWLRARELAAGVQRSVVLSKPFNQKQLFDAAAKLVRKPADVYKLRS
jgi:hypothetical protein